MSQYEMRVYQIASGKMGDIQSAMREVMIPLMREYQIEPISFFASEDGERIYWFCRHDGNNSIGADWDRFHADQRWTSAMAERTNGTPFVASETSTPMQGIAGLAPMLEDQNMATVGDYADGLFRRRDFGVIDKHVAPNFKQHNPHAPDGIEGVKGFAERFIGGNPDLVAEGKRFAAKGDYVFVHSLFKMNPHERGNALVDIFRLENGKIAEHWDVMQEIPEQTTSGNPMV